MANEIRTTQSAVQILAKDNVEVSVTQAAVQVLVKNNVEIRATQAVMQVLDNTQSADGPRVTQAAVQVLHHHTPCVTQRAQCWKITRTDGITFAFTTHDEPVNFRNLSYKPCHSLSASATDSGVINGGSVGDTTINGLISDDSITEFDLVNGLFDGAKVDVWLVPWDDPEFKEDSPQRLTSGVLGAISRGDVTYKAEMLSSGFKLANKPLLDTFTPACRWTLGDGRCPVDLSLLTYTSSVEIAIAKNPATHAQRRQFIDSTVYSGDGYYDGGTLTWLTGDNAGLSSEVKTYLDDTITLWKIMPFDIAFGDQYEITPGCNKTKDDHINKFGLDMTDFGGFPDIPGQDKMLQTPNAKG